MLPNLVEVERRRKALGLSQKDLARFCGIGRGTIGKLETDRLNPSYKMAKKIFDELERLEWERRNLSSFRGLTLDQIQAKPVTFVESSQRVNDVWGRMFETGFSQFPVRQADRPIPVGSINEKKINQAIREKDVNLVKELPVSELMEEPFPMLRTNMPLVAAFSLLDHTQAILTIEGGEIVGIITDTDIGRVFSIFKKNASR